MPGAEGSANSHSSSPLASTIHNEPACDVMPLGKVRPEGKTPRLTAVPGAVGSANSHKSSPLELVIHNEPSCDVMPRGEVRPDGKLPRRTAVPGAVGSANSHKSSSLESTIHNEPACDVMPLGRVRSEGKMPRLTAVPGAEGSANSHSSSPVASVIHNEPACAVMPPGAVRSDGKLPRRTAVLGSEESVNSHNSSPVVSVINNETASVVSAAYPIRPPAVGAGTVTDPRRLYVSPAVRPRERQNEPVTQPNAGNNHIERSRRVEASVVGVARAGVQRWPGLKRGDAVRVLNMNREVVARAACSKERFNVRRVRVVVNLEIVRPSIPDTRERRTGHRLNRAILQRAQHVDCRFGSGSFARSAPT